MSEMRIVDEVDGRYEDVVFLTDDEFDMLPPDEQALFVAYWQREFYRRDPVAWGRERLNEHWWSAQRNIIEAVQVHRRVAVKSCHEIGKDFIAARAACHWIDTGTPHKRAVVTTAASGDQVKVVLWKEINQAHRKGKLIGRVTLTEWHLDNEIVGVGRKVADYNPTSFHGVHAPEGVLVIYDEGCGVVEDIFQAGNSMAANYRSRQLAIGNPDDPDCYFATLFRPSSDWHQIAVSAYDSPNFTAEAAELPRDVLDSLIDRSYVDGLIREYGAESPIVISKVYGNFPEDSTDGVVPWSKLQQCRNVEQVQDGRHDLGVDVAASEEGDGDATVIRERKGNTALGEWTVHSSEAEVVAGEVIRVIHDTGATRVKVDSIGIGWGIVGILDIKRKEGVHDAEVIGVNVAEKAADPLRFKNLRCELWWEVAREPIVSGERNTTGLNEITQDDLIAPQYSINANGQIVVEPKAETKKRLKRSPDHADSYILAFYEPVVRAPGKSMGSQISNARLGALT